MNNVLSGLERDIVVSYLCEDDVPFTLVPSQPAERIFSFVTGIGGVQVLSEGIILFTDSFALPVDLVNSLVEIRFYFRKLGLSFSGRVSRTKTGALAVVVPKEILRLADSVSPMESPFACRLFLGESFSGDCLDCRQWNGFPLFVPQAWRSIPEPPSKNLQKNMERLCGAVPAKLPPLVVKAMSQSGKAVVVAESSLCDSDPFPFDGCITKADSFVDQSFLDSVRSVQDGFYFMTGGNSSVIGQVYGIRNVVDPQHICEIIPLLSAAYFLSCDSEKNEAVKGRAAQLLVLYVSSSEMILACEHGEFPLQTEIPYSVLLQVPMRSMRRSITLVCSVDSVYSQNNRTCACCRLSSVKAEDQRFLYESLNGKRFI